MSIKTAKHTEFKNEDLFLPNHYSDYGKVGACYLMPTVYASRFQHDINRTGPWGVGLPSNKMAGCVGRVINKDGYILFLSPLGSNVEIPIDNDRVWATLENYLSEEGNVVSVPDTSYYAWKPVQKFDRVASVFKKTRNTGLLRQYRQAESPLELLIEKSKVLKTLPFDWDEDGALPIEETTFNVSTSFLRQYVTFILKHFANQIQLPEINPCSDGSIDLEWHTHNAQLLINFRKDKEGNYIAYYYGDRHNNKMQVKGSTPVNEFSEHLAVWMKYLV